MLTHHNLADQLDYEGPRAFSLTELETVDDLFAWRCVLSYTPTAEIPTRFVGDGPFSVHLSVPTPCCLLQHTETRGFGGPRLLLDLLQRETAKIRWNPLARPHVTITRFDSAYYPEDDIGCGTKALVDALKVSTTGRLDAMLLHYFGGIADDGLGQVLVSIRQAPVSEARQAYCQLTVERRS